MQVLVCVWKSGLGVGEFILVVPRCWRGAHLFSFGVFLVLYFLNVPFDIGCEYAEFSLGVMSYSLLLISDCLSLVWRLVFL